MLQVTARVFDNNQLVGYQITDGQQTQLFTRQQAWTFAKNKQLLNVVATGDETNPGLSGTNGFELKRLPEIKWKEPSSVKTSQKFTFNTQDLDAALIRNAVNTGNYIIKKEADNIDNYTMEKKVAKEYLKVDVNNGVVTPQNCRTLSNSLLVENTLYDSTAKANTLAIGIGSKLSKRDKKLFETFEPMYSTFRLIADILQETMELNHTDTVTATEIEMAVANSNSEAVKEFRQQGGTVPKLFKGINKIFEIKKTIVPNAGSGGVITKDMLDELNSSLNEMKMNANAEGIEVTQAIIGYKVMNIGSQSIPVTRMTATPDHSTSQVSLNPGQSMCLNRAEMAILAGRPEVSCTFANGKLSANSRHSEKKASLYDFLTRYYFNFEKVQINTEDSHRYRLNMPDRINVNNPNIKMDVRKLESPDIVNTYFTPDNAAQAAQQTQKSIQQKGLFNGFKR